MARVVANLSPDPPVTHYAKFFDGQPWSLDMHDAARGVKDLASLHACIIRTAKRLNVHVKTRRLHGRLEVQAFGVNLTPEG
jgi:hypothetical protein